jgi:hypothetical protein
MSALNPGTNLVSLEANFGSLAVVVKFSRLGAPSYKSRKSRLIWLTSLPTIKIFDLGYKHGRESWARGREIWAVGRDIWAASFQVRKRRPCNQVRLTKKESEK